MSEQYLLKEKANKSRRNIIIVGVGNRLLGDEEVGSHIIVSIINCGCDLLSLMSQLNKPRKIIIVDAMCAGGKPVSKAALQRF